MNKKLIQRPLQKAREVNEISLESGRNLGFISSLIVVVLPLLLVPVFLIVFFSAFNATFSGTAYLTGNPLSLTFVPLLIAVYAVLAVLGLVAIILFMIAMHRLASYYQEPVIFNGALYWLILSIVGAVVAAILEVAFLAFFFGNITPVTPGSPVSSPEPILQAILAVFGVAAVVFVFMVAGTVFFMRALNALGNKSGVQTFKTAGLLSLIGYILTIFFVGGIVVWVAWILLAVGFHSLKPAAAYSPSSQPSSSSFTAEQRYCPYCGAENSYEDKFCRKCGRPL